MEKGMAAERTEGDLVALADGDANMADLSGMPGPAGPAGMTDIPAGGRGSDLPPLPAQPADDAPPAGAATSAAQPPAAAASAQTAKAGAATGPIAIPLGPNGPLSALPSEPGQLELGPPAPVAEDEPVGLRKYVYIKRRGRVLWDDLTEEEKRLYSDRVKIVPPPFTPRADAAIEGDPDGQGPGFEEEVL